MFSIDRTDLLLFNRKYFLSIEVALLFGLKHDQVLTWRDKFETNNPVSDGCMWHCKL